jgi:acetate kinase
MSATYADLDRYLRTVNFLAAAQVYLQGNPLLEEPLKPAHVRERLLGHWGTCPGINFIYAHLNQKSGLLGVSGRSADVREVVAAAPHDPQAALAVDMFCYRVRKAIGAYLAALGGAQAIVFGGGIGENQPAIRARICEGMDWCGLILDPARNAAAIGTAARISRDGSHIEAWVIPVEEAALMAQAAAECLSAER